MPNALHKPPASMTVAEFLAWPGDEAGVITCEGPNTARVPDLEVLRRRPDGRWPEALDRIGERETLSFECIGFAGPLLDVYAETSFGKEDLA